MPSIRKLSPAEVDALRNPRKGQRKTIEEEYDAILSEYNLGDYGVAELGDEEKRLTVRNRLRRAAERRGLSISFRRTKGPKLRFQIIGNDAAPIAPAPIVHDPVPEPAPKPKKKGGRPPKNAATK
jgi:hypothetical protein